jgi:type I restriction enzyme, R subunit
MNHNEPEKVTRKKRIDANLKNLGWNIVPYETGLNTSTLTQHAVEEYPTSNGPADYALFVNGQLLGIVEAKKYGIGAQNVLEQAKRYARGVVHSIGRWGEYMVPFLFSSSGEQVYFLDVRQPQNLSRSLQDFYSPHALSEFFLRNETAANEWFQQTPIDNPRLRPYQIKAIAAVEKEMIAGKRKMLLAMATGTGKTFTTVNQIYRLLKSKKAKRILFLVDRKALAAQAATAFASFETASGLKLNQEYELYSQRFKKEDLDENEKFDVNVLPNEYLTKPDASKTFVYVATIQRMAINLLGKDAVMGNDDNDNDDESDAAKLDIPVHAFDVIIADECHRGYTSKESNVWRAVLEYFDAVKIGLTATPAMHTVSYFGEPVYRYTVKEAELDGYLVGYDAVKIKSGVLINGVFLKEGEQIGKVDTLSGQLTIEGLEDERQFDASQVERKITVPDTNKKIVEELAKYCFAFEEEYGRFPKTLIFASNDINNISHADNLVTFCKQTFNRGDDFVVKITGNANVDRPLEKIRKFRNRPEPKVVISVDMLSTGVDIPQLEFIVFLRPVKSRILWEQMLGRGTRLCPDINKEKFTVFDCFDGTLIKYFKNVSNFAFDEPGSDPIPIEEVIRRIDNNEERDHHVTVFIKRLRRIEKRISSEGRREFEPWIKDGDIGKFAGGFRKLLDNQFGDTMRILNDKQFQKLLYNYKKANPYFVVAHNVQDEVSSEVVFEAGEQYLKPLEYLEAFAAFVEENKERIEAMKIVLEKPKEWRTEVLKELRTELLRHHFPEASLKHAAQLVHKKHLPDIISLIKTAANKEELLEVHERVGKAIEKLFAGKQLNAEQDAWIAYIKEHLIQNLTLDKEDFDYSPILERHGGWGKFKKVFHAEAETIIREINTAIAA